MVTVVFSFARKTSKGQPGGLATLGPGGKILTSQLPGGVTNGLATLDTNGRVPASQLPFSAPDFPAAGLAASLARQQTAVIQLLSDSTGVGTTSWFGRIGTLLGAKYPAYNVLHRAWNAATQWYDAPTSLQSGPSGDSRITFAGSGAMRWSAAAITGDLDVRVRVLPTSWASGAVQVLAGRWASTGNQRSWWFGLSLAGSPVMTWTTDGASGTQVQVASSVNATAFAASLAAGQPGWLRVTLDVDNGASGNDVKFYTSTDGATWTQLGTTRTTAGVTSVFAGTAQYQIGALDTTVGSTFAGSMYWAEIRDTIDGVSLVPPLPATWDYATNASANTTVRAGSPTLLLVNGSEVGQTVAYWDNSTRRPRALSAHRQDLILMSSGHNEDFTFLPNFVTSFDTWATNVKTLHPFAPMVAVSQNPQQSPRSVNQIQAHAARGAGLMGWAKSRAGVYGIDAYAAFTDLATQVQSDGVHPTATGAQAEADYVLARLGL